MSTKTPVGLWLARIAVAALCLCGPRGAAAISCTGDCDEGGRVTIDELILGVQIVLGGFSVSSCKSLDADSNGTVTIEELVAAVASSLALCTPVTQTPTHTPTTSPTPTATNGPLVPVGLDLQVNTAPIRFLNTPMMVVGDPSGFLVAWQDRWEIHHTSAQRFSRTGEPLGSEFLVEVPVGTFGIASESGGAFVVTWQDYRGDSDLKGVLARRHASDGTPLGDTFRVNSYTVKVRGGVSIARHAGGNHLVVWPNQDRDGSEAGVFAQAFTSGGSRAGSEFQVNGYTPGLQYSAQVAAITDGFVVVWTSAYQDGGGLFRPSGVFARRVAATGSAVGTEFLVNTFTPGQQRGAAVAGLPDGFVVTWTSRHEEGFNTAVLAQRYSATAAPVGSEFRVSQSTAGYRVAQNVMQDPIGGFVVTWVDFETGAVGRRFDDQGQPTAGDFPLVGTQGAVSAADGQGRFMFLRGDGRRDNATVFARQYVLCTDELECP